MESKHANHDACLHRDFTDLYDYPVNFIRYITVLKKSWRQQGEQDYLPNCYANTPSA
jgi:hypothetical protein